MEFLRYSRDVWGQTVLEGMSWDLFWFFVSGGIISVIGHLIFMQFATEKTKPNG